jgi:hypothetical protein
MNPLTFAVVMPALLVAPTIGDHWIQTSHQANAKGQRDKHGRLACAAHVASYTLTTAALVVLVWALFDLPISPVWFITGQVVSAVTHYWADRRFTLAWLCDQLGKGGFYRLGLPRDGRDDNPSLGTGAYALDQSWHWGWLFVAGLLTSVAW